MAWRASLRLPTHAAATKRASNGTSSVSPVHRVKRASPAQRELLVRPGRKVRKVNGVRLVSGVRKVRKVRPARRARLVQRVPPVRRVRPEQLDQLERPVQPERQGRLAKPALPVPRDWSVRRVRKVPLARLDPKDRAAHPDL
jgi:hypothetical protein